MNSLPTITIGMIPATIRTLRCAICGKPGFSTSRTAVTPHGEEHDPCRTENIRRREARAAAVRKLRRLEV